MADLRVGFEAVVREHADDFGRRRARLRDRVGDVFGPLRRARQIDAAAGRLDGAQFGVRLGDPAVFVTLHAEHHRGGAAFRRWHHGCFHDDHVGLDTHVGAGQRVGAQNDEMVALAVYLAHASV